MVNWHPYLDSICNTYAQWWEVYTITDVVGPHRVESESSPLLLDFMVQTVEWERDERGKQEKVERLTVLEGLRKYASEHVLLVGRPGSGKSTALVRLVLEEAEKSSRLVGARHVVPLQGIDGQTKIPVLVELRYYRTSILDLIQDFLQRHDPYLTVDAETLKSWLRQGQLLLLVDGLNELPSEEARRDLHKLRQDYQQTTPMIFTTRDLGVGGDLDITKKLEMQPLSEAQMRQFVRAYLPQQGEQMLRHLGSRLREFGQTPLLLWMLCSLFRAMRKVPPNLGLVFRQFTESYYGKLKQDVPISDESRDWCQLLLERLAFRMTQGREKTALQVAISKQEAEEILTAFLRDEGLDQPRNRALQWLKDLLKHHLIQLGAGNQIEFRHQLIQEYYTAEYLLKVLSSPGRTSPPAPLLRGEGSKIPVPPFPTREGGLGGLGLDDEELKWEYLNYLKWTEPLALMLELVEDEVQAMRGAKLALEVDWWLGARLAGAVKPEFQEQTVGLVAALEIPQLLKIQLLGKTKSDRAILRLYQSLEDEDYDVRKNAAYTLNRIDKQVTSEVLVKAIGNEDYYLFYLVGNRIDKIGNLGTIYNLDKALKNKDFFVRRFAIEALTEIGSAEATDVLVKAFKFGVIDRDKGLLAEALGKIGNAVVVDALIEFIIGRNGNTFTYMKAAEALGRIRNPAAINALTKALDHESYIVRKSAANALNLIDKVAASAVDFLTKINKTAIIDALVKALEAEDSSTRWDAAETLVRVGDQAATDALVKVLKHEKSSVRRSAVEALLQIGNTTANSALVKALDDRDSFVRWRAAEALSKIGQPGAIILLIKTLKNQKFVAANQGDTLGHAVTALQAIQNLCEFYNPTLTQPMPTPQPQPNIPPIQHISTSLMHILHLSDLHFGTPDQANLWSNQLAADLTNDLSIPQLDALILSGDIANYSTQDEYKAAAQFLNELRKDFPLNPEQIILVPGNHDLNWKLAKKAYKLIDRDDYNGELTDDNHIKVDENVIRIRDEAEYKQRFAHFSQFYESIKQKPYPLDYDQQFTLDHLPEQNLLILGLNSAWQLDHHYKTRASINTNALSNALTQIRRNPDYKNSLKIAVWHHPLNSAWEDRITDQGFIEQLAVNGFRLYLHGHIHKAETSPHPYDLTPDGRKLDRICAGTFGAPVREWVPGYPLQYNLLKIADNHLTVYTRRREELNGAWKPDARWLQGAGKSPADFYTIKL